MAADFAGDTADVFIVAQYSQWAGDFDHALVLFHQIAGGTPSTGVPPLAPIPVSPLARQQFGSSDALLRTSAIERYNGLVAKIREFTTIRSRFPPPYDSVEYTPVVIIGRHIRGTVWRTGARVFILRAYLKTLAKAGDLKYLVGEAYQRGEHNIEEIITSPTRDEEDEIIESGGLSWSIPGNPFITVTFSELGLIEAQAFWSAQSPPASFDLIRTPLQELFNSLDPS